MNFLQQDNLLIIKVDKTLYPEDVLYKCLYWYTGKYNVSVESGDDGFYKVAINLTKHGHFDEEARQLNDQFMRDIVDFKLRDIVTKETQTIRELIVAKAFANFEFDIPSESDISDPVGFNPEDI